MSTLNIRGLSELQAMLRTLPAKVERNILRAALRQGANVIKDEAKANVPQATGVLRRGIKVSTSTKGGKVTASIKTKGKHGYIARWLEYGTRPHVIEGRDGGNLAFEGGAYRSVNHPGIRPTPFMRPAMDSKAGEAVVAVGEAIKNRLTSQGLDASAIDIELEE